MYQNEKAEAKRLHGVRKPKKDEEMAWAPPRKKVGLARAGKRRQRRQKASGGWSSKVKRRCQKSLSCRMRWKGGDRWRRQLARRVTSSLSLFMAANGLEVEEEISTMPTQHWAEGVWTGKWSCEQNEAWMRQIREVRTWKQVRGPPGASDV